MKRKTLFAFVFALVALGSLPCLSQNVRWDPPTDAAAITTQGTGLPFLVAIPNVAVNFCAYPANAVPCTNKVVTFNGISGSACSTSLQITLPTSSTCQATSDAVGNWGVYVPFGTYQYTITVSGTSYGPFTASVGGSGGTTVDLEVNATPLLDQTTLNLADGANGGAGSGIFFVHPANLVSGTVTMDFETPGFANEITYDTGTALSDASGTTWNNSTQTLTIPNLVISTSCTGCATGSVASVGVVAGQTVNSGTSSNPIIGLASPLTPPGNVQITQLSNGSNAVTITARSPTSPAGNLLQFQSAGLAALAWFDFAGNLVTPSVTTTGSGAGYTAIAAGSDNGTACLNTLAALGVTGRCIEGATSIGASWVESIPNTAPAAFSVYAVGAATGSPLEAAEHLVPTTDSSSPTFIQSAIASAASAANNNVACFDGGGNTKDCGVNLSAINQNCNSGSVNTPVVCGEVNSTGITTNLPSTNILTGTVAAGQYRLSVYLNGTTACAGTVSGNVFVAKVAYTDSNGSVPGKSVVALGISALPFNTTGIITFWNQSSTSTINISGTYSTCTALGGSGTATIDAHYVLERLQ